MRQVKKHNCKLCLGSEATQTGSHLLSSFMVESMVGERGKEKGYLITSNPDFDYLQDTGASHIITDFILCRGCEQRLAYVESYISQEWLHKIESENHKVNFPKTKEFPTHYLKECKRVNSAAFYLFIASIIWRISISSNPAFKKFKVTPSQEEAIRKCLNQLLPAYGNYKVKPNRKKWLWYINKELPKQSLFLFTIITSENKKDKEANIVLVPHFIKYPYTMMLNEFILLVYFDKIDFSKIQEDFFNLGPIMTDNSCINTVGDTIKITYVSDIKWRSIIIQQRDRLAIQKMASLIKYYSTEFLKRLGRLPNMSEIKEMILSARLRM